MKTKLRKKGDDVVVSAVRRGADNGGLWGLLAPDVGSGVGDERRRRTIKDFFKEAWKFVEGKQDFGL